MEFESASNLQFEFTFQFELEVDLAFELDLEFERGLDFEFQTEFALNATFEIEFKLACELDQPLFPQVSHSTALRLVVNRSARHDLRTE